MAFASGVISLFVILLIVYLVIGGIGLASYILQSIALYTIADKRNINNAWLAWVPIGSSWIIGSLVDFHHAVEGKKSNWRTTLTVLLSVGVVGFFTAYIAVFIFAFMMGFAFADTYMEEMMAVPTIGGLLMLEVFLIAAALIMQAASICQYICVYKLFEVLVPEKAIKYTVISLVVPLGLPLCLMKCRNSQNGIPAPAPCMCDAVPVTQPRVVEDNTDFAQEP